MNSINMNNFSHIDTRYLLGASTELLVTPSSGKQIGAPSQSVQSSPIEVETSKYGDGKPYRVIISAKISHD